MRHRLVLDAVRRGRLRRGRGGRRRGWSLAAVTVVLLTASACGGSDAESGDDPSPASSATTSDTAEADASAALVERCASQFPDAEAVTAGRVRGPGFDLQTATFTAADPTGSAVILLPQVGAAGLCGWGPFATYAARRGVTAIAVDPCGIGGTEGSTCTPKGDGDLAAQVEAVVDVARRRLDADRVFLAGTSAGGSDTVAAVADGAEVAGWADVSGPSSWDDGPLLAMAENLPRGGLVVQARSDGDDEYAAARRLARAAGARFVDGGDGHGWELLVDYDRTLLPAGVTLLDYLGARPARG